ncbi:MAG: glycoside hydrolase family 172 protein [Candidatus Hodarchaeales archaeon]
MTLKLNLNYEDYIYAQDIPWKTKQVSTHGHDRLVDAKKVFLPQLKPFRKRGVLHRDWVTIEPNNEFEFPVMEGPGCIVNIWFTFSSYSFSKFMKYNSSWEARKKIVIQIFFDDEKVPSVNSPIGDFFGVGFGKYRDYQSKYLEETSGGYICRFPMPFKKNARVVVKNTNQKKALEPYYFHARYREEIPTVPRIPYKLFDAQGTGFYAGCVLNQENVKRGDGYRFLEGNTKFYVDGEITPSLEYTGTEDIFQGAYYYASGSFSARYSGCTVHSWKKLGLIRYLRGYTRRNKISQYRFHEADAIPFKKSLLVFIHHGEFDEIPTNQSSVTYFYARKPVKTNWDTLKLGEFPDEEYYIDYRKKD